MVLNSLPKNDLALPSKIEYVYPIRPNSIYLKLARAHIRANVCIRVVIAVLFNNAKPPHNPSIPSVVQRISTVWCVHHTQAI